MKLRIQPIDKFVIYKSLTKSPGEYKSKPPHARVANSNDFIGSKIGYIVTQYRKNKILAVERYDENKTIQPALNYYETKQIGRIYERVLLPIIDTGNQRRLFK